MKPPDEFFSNEVLIAIMMRVNAAYAAAAALEKETFECEYCGRKTRDDNGTNLCAECHEEQASLQPTPRPPQVYKDR